MILPTLETGFRALSTKHEALLSRSQGLLRDYAAGQLDDPSYAVIGTFGAGKTQFLFWVFKASLEERLLPLYFLAEDLFAEIIKSDQPYTQGDLDSLVARKIDRSRDLLCSDHVLSQEEEKELSAMLGPREASAELLTFARAHLRQRHIDNPKPVILVDELEVQYRHLQRRVQSEGDRSPLRELLSRRSCLKFVSLAPAGIYEMGNADQTRVIRLIIPAADVTYIRAHLIPHVGRANAAWWLSRGKARHLLKACEVLRKLPEAITPSDASRIIRGELDQVGQHPTQVPAAVTEDIPPSRLPDLLDIVPKCAQSAKCYHVDTGIEGELAEHMAAAFAIDRDTAMLFAEYFDATARAMADADGIAYVPGEELPELFALALDHLLEYEHGSPTLSDKMGDLLGLYERLRSDPAALYGEVAVIWNHQPSDKRLPFHVQQIRRAFPFPLMNPIVKDHEPQAMKSKYEGKGVPLWRWSEGNVACLCFASARDLKQYGETDEFISLSVPDGSGILMLLFAGELPGVAATPLMMWLKAAGKLEIEEVPQLLTDFLLSALGEVTAPLPGDLRTQLHRFRGDRSDVVLSRKAGIYADAIQEITSSSLPQPRVFCDHEPPDTDKWGHAKISETAAVCGLALAFTDLATEQKTLLARLRELYKGGREGRGAGDLTKLKPRGGTITLADDVLPRLTMAKLPSDSGVIQRVQSYWVTEDREALSQLARLVPIGPFVRLSEEPDRRRLLAALWRSTRQDFDFGDEYPNLLDLHRLVKNQVLPVVEEAHELERNVKQKLNMTGVTFDFDEVLVKAKGGLAELCDIMESALKLTDTAGASAVRIIVRIFAHELDASAHVKSLQVKCSAAKQATERLLRTADLLVKNFYEFPKAVRFLGLASESVLQEYAAEQLSIRRTLSPQQLTTEAQERQQRLDSVSGQLRRLQESLERLREVLANDDNEG